MVFILSITFTAFAQENSAELINIKINSVDNNVISKITDNNIYTYHNFDNTDNLEINSDSNNIKYIYILWNKPPKTYTIEFNNQKIICGENGFLHELIKLDNTADYINITQLKKNSIADIFFYSDGKLPKDVQNWQKPYSRCDILAFPTHSDDDTLYMGALISEYAGRGKKIQIAYMTNHWNTVDRPHELLNGLWEMGVCAYPIIPDFPDLYTRSLEHAKILYNTQDLLNYQIETIRRTKPLIIIGHDENGEYGHGVHILNTLLLKDAIVMANDKTKHTESFNKYGNHLVLKTYFHLYPKNQIILDVHKKYDFLNDLSPYEVAKNGFSKHLSQHHWDLAVLDYGTADCRLFGLYKSEIGYEFKTNDIFENLYFNISKRYKNFVVC